MKRSPNTWMYILSIILLAAIVFLWYNGGLVMRAGNYESIHFSFKDFCDDSSRTISTVLLFVGIAAMVSLLASVVLNRLNDRRFLYIPLAEAIVIIVCLLLALLTAAPYNSAEAAEEGVGLSLDGKGWLMLALYAAFVVFIAELSRKSGERVIGDKSLPNRYCEKCGALLPESRICSSCGADYSRTKSSLTEKIKTPLGRLSRFLLQEPGYGFSTVGLIFVVLSLFLTYDRPYQAVYHRITGIRLILLILLCVATVAAMVIRVKRYRTIAVGALGIAGLVILISYGKGSEHGYDYLVTGVLLMLCGFLLTLLDQKKTDAKILQMRSGLIEKLSGIAGMKGGTEYILGIVLTFFAAFIPFKNQFHWYGWGWRTHHMIDTGSGYVLFFFLLLALIGIYRQNRQLFRAGFIFMTVFEILWLIIVIWSAINPDGENIKLLPGFFVMLIVTCLQLYGGVQILKQ